MTAITHDPYTCAATCCASHEADRCSLCGHPRGRAYSVTYLLGAETDDTTRWGQYREPDRWIVFCGPCDAAWCDCHGPMPCDSD